MQQGWRKILRAGLIIGLMIAGIIPLLDGIQGKANWSQIGLGSSFSSMRWASSQRGYGRHCSQLENEMAPSQKT